ncbi:MAG: hypothetical protein WAT39_09960 [Planctomycetota bacterium]
MANPLLSAFLRSLAPLALLGALLAQAPVPPVDPKLPDDLKELKGLVAEPKMVADFQAISLIQKLMKAVDGMNPKDKEKLAKGLGDLFRTGKVRPADKDVLYRETGDALGKLGADGAKELAKALADVRFKDAIALQAHLMLALGKTEDEAQVDLLVDTTTRSVHDELRAASGEALGNYTSLEIKARREVVKAIVRAWGSLHSKATTADNNDPSRPIDMEPQNARKTLKAVEGKWGATLSRLTGMSMTGFQDWQRWLNKNPSWTGPVAKKT